jgi:creatinine amidohydrolase/Fe(II)-dependent formamide hydrolase-like protein
MDRDPRWATLTHDEVGECAQRGAVAVLPVGATEQHGPHLVTGADSLFAERVAMAAVSRTLRPATSCRWGSAAGTAHGRA